VITKIELFTLQPDAPVLPLGGFMPNDDPVQIRGITGVDPVKANIALTAYASGRGALYQGSTTPERNIVMTLGFNPDWEGQQTIASLRQILYRYLMPQHWTKLRFFSQELPDVDIEGYVESFEANMFSQDPEVQVSIICPKPDFIEPDATIFNGTVDDGTLEEEFEYTGTIETGFEMRVDQSVDNPDYTGSFTVKLTALGEEQIFTITPVTVDGQRYFKLSTVRNAKRAQSVSKADGSLTNLLSGVTGGSVWPAIKPGKNILSIAATEMGQVWTMAYFNRYGGL
jgi:hypothetical protein